MMTRRSGSGRLGGWRRRAFLILVTLPMVLGVLAACEGKDADRYTPPPATIIRASDTLEPSTTPAQKAPSQGSPQPAGTVSSSEGYPEPVTTIPSATPEAYPAK